MLIFGAAVFAIVFITILALNNLKDDISVLAGAVGLTGFLAFLVFAVMYEPAPLVIISKRAITLKGHKKPFLWEDIDNIITQRGVEEPVKRADRRLSGIPPLEKDYDGSFGVHSIESRFPAQLIRHTPGGKAYVYTSGIYLIIDVNKPDKYPADGLLALANVCKMEYRHRVNIAKLNMHDFELLEAELPKYTKYIKGLDT